MSHRKPSLALLFVALFTLTSPLFAQKSLSNNDIMEMAKAGFDEQTILTAIHSSDPAFDTSVPQLLSLKQNGVSENIISAMLAAMKAKADRQEADARAAADRAEQIHLAELRAAAAGAGNHGETNPEVPDDVGVYALINSQLTEIPPEIYSWRTGGVGKSILTLGITKGHINGAVTGPHSKTRLLSPLEIVIRCPETMTAAEYQLVKMDQKDDRREFRALTGGVVHASADTERNAVSFEYKKIAPRTYKIVLSHLAPGEYGFLPLTPANIGGVGGGTSGAVEGGTINPGKVYSFQVAR